MEDTERLMKSSRADLFQLSLNHRLAQHLSSNISPRFQFPLTFKIALLAFKSLPSTAPSYLSPLIPTRVFRSSKKQQLFAPAASEMLVQPFKTPWHWYLYSRCDNGQYICVPTLGITSKLPESVLALPPNYLKVSWHYLQITWKCLGITSKLPESVLALPPNYLKVSWHYLQITWKCLGITSKLPESVLALPPNYLKVSWHYLQITWKCLGITSKLPESVLALPPNYLKVSWHYLQITWKCLGITSKLPESVLALPPNYLKVSWHYLQITWKCLGITSKLPESVLALPPNYLKVSWHYLQITWKCLGITSKLPESVLALPPNYLKVSWHYLQITWKCLGITSKLPESVLALPPNYLKVSWHYLQITWKCLGITSKLPESVLQTSYTELGEVELVLELPHLDLTTRVLALVILLEIHRLPHRLLKCQRPPYALQRKQQYFNKWIKSNISTQTNEFDQAQLILWQLLNHDRHLYFNIQFNSIQQSLGQALPYRKLHYGSACTVHVQKKDEKQSILSKQSQQKTI